MNTEIKGKKLHHTALARGYQTVKKDCVRPYKGRFGEGFVVFRHNPNSTRFMCVEYWV